MSLESKIKNLLETANSESDLLEEFELEDELLAEASEEEEDAEKEESDDEESEDEEKDVKEGYEGSMTKPKEGESKETANSKITAGLSKKDAAKKLQASEKADAQEDAGLNAKIKAGLDKKDSGGRLAQEEVAALLDGEDLSEEFKQKAESLFEAAVQSAVEKRTEELLEEYDEKLEAIQEELKGSLIESVDGYLGVVVEQWLQDNKVALENNLKIELMNDFVDGMKRVFAENYVELPDEKIDAFAAQTAENEALQEELEKMKQAINESKAEVISLKRAAIIEGVASTLVLSSQEKFKSLCENADFEDEESFAEKINTIKENFFPSRASVKSPVVPEEISAPVGTPEMENYVAALAGHLKFKR